jgi:predicted site-specific integrase-resolvase
MSKIYRINEFAKRVGRHTQTLRRWDAEGKLIAKRLPSGHRFYDESDVRKVFGVDPEVKKVVVYCRVSSSGQKDDLVSQKQAMEYFCISSGIAVSEWVDEIGGGMNFKRKKFLGLMEEIQQGSVTKLIVAHKDRLCRFGFDFFDWMAKQNGCEIIVVNQETLSPQKEIVEDLMAIIHTFSCRLYGLRKYKKDIKKLITEKES